MADDCYVDRELKKNLERIPFTRFYVLSGGQRYEVTDRHQVAFNGNLLIIVHPKRGLKYFKKSDIVAIHQGSWDVPMEQAGSQ